LPVGRHQLLQNQVNFGRVWAVQDVRRFFVEQGKGGLNADDPAGEVVDRRKQLADDQRAERDDRPENPKNGVLVHGTKNLPAPVIQTSKSAAQITAKKTSVAM